MVRRAGAVHQLAADERARVAEDIFRTHQLSVHRDLELGFHADGREAQSRTLLAALAPAVRFLRFAAHCPSTTAVACWFPAASSSSMGSSRRARSPAAPPGTRTIHPRSRCR